MSKIDHCINGNLDENVFHPKHVGSDDATEEMNDTSIDASKEIEKFRNESYSSISNLQLRSFNIRWIQTCRNFLNYILCSSTDVLDVSLENILKFMKHVGLVFTKAALGVEGDREGKYVCLNNSLI